MASTSWLENAFREARRDFLAKIPPQHHLEFSKFGTIDAVYTEINDIQQKQSKTKTLVALSRIEPYLIGLRDYFGVVDTFAQVYPEIFCLVWGPLKLILQLANSAATAFQKLVEVLGEIGRMLPQFKKYAESGIFDKNQHVRDAMGLFYRDILDLHLEMFNFFKKKSLHVLLESLWPHFRNKLAVVQRNIESHKMLITSSVTLEHVLQAYAMRSRMLEKHDEDKKYQIWTKFKSLRDRLASSWCESRLQSAVKASSAGSGDWMFNHSGFQIWLESTRLEERCIWIQGIPGAGKTFLTANAIHRLRTESHVVLYAFLSQDRQSFGDTIPLLQSFVFQLAEANRDLVDHIHDAYFNSSHDLTTTQQVKDLFCNLVNSSGPLIIAVDGLDEIESDKRVGLLKTLIDILGACDKIRLLLSSREERDIIRVLEGKSGSLKVNENNEKEIEEYVQIQGDYWITELQELGADDADCAAIREGLNGVVTRANGMFLYPKLVLGLARAQVDLKSIRAELANLPDGLDQAYGRVLSRLKSREDAKKILLWIACAKTPLKEVEIKQALLIQPSMSDFARQKVAWVDIRAKCGPVIEIRDGMVRFVHFTAREYLLGLQSKNFLNLYDGHLEAAEVVLTYLSLESFDPMFSPNFTEEDKKDLRRRLLSGDMILFRYAADFWLEHLRDLGQEPLAEMERMEPINRAVVRFFKSRGTEAKAGDPKRARLFLREFSHFKAVPVVQRSLAESARFLHRLQYGDIVPEGEQWVLNDPTALSLATNRFQETLETTLGDCEESTHSACSCLKVREFYGDNVFRCRWTFCVFHRNGFTSALRRDEHEETHRTTFRCKVLTCIFAAVGFRSERELLIHIGEMHADSQHGLPPPSVNTPDTLCQLATSEVLAMLEHSVINSDINLAESLLAIVSEREQNVDFDLLLQLAAWKGSESMIEFLVAKAKSPQARKTSGQELTTLLQNSLFLAVFLDNVDGVRSLLKSGATINGEGGVCHVEVRRRFLPSRGIAPRDSKTRVQVMDAAFENMNPRMLQLLIEEFGGKAAETCLLDAIRGTKKDHEKFTGRLPQVKRFIPSVAYSYGILSSVLFEHPVALDICLENGGDPNFSQSAHRCKDSALYAAVEKTHFLITTPEQRVILFGCIEKLLRAGSNPYPLSPHPNKKGESIVDLDGMKAVEEHFGMKWHELVKDIQERKGD